jgi:cytoskeletal protein CcmA (bactofilin family)
MSFFKRNKDKGTEKSESSATSSETSPQRVGVVSGILTTSATLGGSLPIGEIVDRHFGPTTRETEMRDDPTDGPNGSPDDRAEHGPEDVPALPPRHEHLRAVENRPEEEMDFPRLEVDPMAHVGHETTITGTIVAMEDLEIQGTIEGSIRLADHQLTVGSDGFVKANVEAHSVLVLGRISGDVVASEWVEIKAGGVIGGDVKSPRVIMHDGAVVVGGLDMSAALPSSGLSSIGEECMPERPKLIRVEPPSDFSKDEDRG